MRVDRFSAIFSEKNSPALDYDLESSARLRRERKNLEESEAKTALRKVEEVRESNVQESLNVMDRHHAMVADSQKFYKEKERKKTLEVDVQQNREEQRALLARMALNNAERSELHQTKREEP